MTTSAPRLRPGSAPWSLSEPATGYTDWALLVPHLLKFQLSGVVPLELISRDGFRIKLSVGIGVGVGVGVGVGKTPLINDALSIVKTPTLSIRWKAVKETALAGAVNVFE